MTNEQLKVFPILSWQQKNCSLCPNLAAYRTQVVVASPCSTGGLLAIGEAPGVSEDIRGEGFVGDAGKNLDKLLNANGITRDSYGRANVCRCRPPENRKPTSQEIKACVPFLANLIHEVRPKVILAVGGRTSTTVFCGSGSLYSKIKTRSDSNDWSAEFEIQRAHKLIQAELKAVAYIVPMPHTSPLALNRYAPSGEKWSHIAERQVSLAVKLLKQAT